MTAARVTTFRNSRARLQRMGDGAWLAGWTRHLSRDEVRLRLRSYVPLEGGSPVEGECYGDGARVSFRGVVAAQEGQDVAVRTTGSLVFDPHPESIRIAVEGLVARIEHERGPFELILSDVSPASFGGFCAAPLPLVQTLDFVVEGRGERIEGRASVVNCRADPQEPGAFRAGVRVLQMPRLSAARWARLVEAAALA